MHTSEKVILFNDIVSSTKLWGKYGDKMYNELNRIIKKINELIKIYDNSFIIKTIGDSFMISFDTIYNALEFSIKFENFLTNTTSKLGINKRLHFRTGIYLGVVNEKKIKIQNCIVKDFFGSTVNIASRLESKVSEPDTIAIGISSNKDIINIINFLKSKNYKYKIEDFYKKCNFKNKIYIIKNKTKNIKIKEKCKTIKLLKGIKQNIKVLIINK